MKLNLVTCHFSNGPAVHKMGVHQHLHGRALGACEPSF